MDIHASPVFNIGDVIALQLQTLNKLYIEPSSNNNWQYKISKADFYELDGKYIVIKKLADKVSRVSRIEPTTRDIWPYFELYDKIFDQIPKIGDINDLNVVKFRDGMQFSESFFSEGRMSYYKKENM